MSSSACSTSHSSLPSPSKKSCKLSSVCPILSFPCHQGNQKMLHRPWFHHRPQFNLPYCLSLPMLSDAMKADADRRPADWLTLAWLYPSCLQMSLDILFGSDECCKLA